MKPNCTNTEWVGRAKCSVCEVRHIVLFSGLANEELDRILYPIDNLHASAGALLYKQSSAGTSLYTVRQGMIKLTRGLPNGGYRIVRLLGPGDIAGQEVLLGQSYRHNAIALQDVDICRIPAELVKQLDQTRQELHRQLLLRWQKSVDEADTLIADLNSGKVESRLARLLIKMACTGKHDPVAMLSREDIGALLGITTETASRAMAELKRQGLVREERGHWVYCDPHRLAALANT